MFNMPLLGTTSRINPSQRPHYTNPLDPHLKQWNCYNYNQKFMLH